MLFVLEPVADRYGKASLWRRRSSIRQMVVMTVVFCGDDIEKSLVTLKLLDIGIWHCPLSRTINTCDVFREQPLLSFSGLNNLVTQGWIRLSFNIDPKSSNNDSRRWRLVRNPGFDDLQFVLYEESRQIKTRKLYVGVGGFVWLMTLIWQLWSLALNASTPGVELRIMMSGILTLVFTVYSCAF